MNREKFNDESDAKVSNKWASLANELGYDGQEQLQNLEAMTEPKERQFFQALGENIINKVNIEIASVSVEVAESQETEPTYVEVEPSADRVLYDFNERLDTEITQEAGGAKKLQTEVVYEEAQSKGLLNSLQAKLHGAIKGLFGNPRSKIAALMAATALSGMNMSNAEELLLDHLTAVETNVDRIEYGAKKANAGKIEKAAKNNKVELIDSGSTMQEVIDAMDGLQYRVYAEFDEDGKKIFEGTQHKRSSVPRPDELGSLKGHTTIKNNVNTNLGFTKEDINRASANQVGQSIIVTDDYVFTLESPDGQWPSKQDINQKYTEAKKEVNAELRQALKDDPDRYTIFSDSENKIAELTAQKLDLNFTVESKEDENGASTLEDSKEYLSCQTEVCDFVNHGDNIYDWMKNAHAEPFEVGAVFAIDDDRTKLLDFTTYNAGMVAYSNSQEASRITLGKGLEDLPRIQLHTHPASSNAFSFADIRSLFAGDSVASIVITRKKVYVLEREDTNKKLSGEGMTQLENDYQTTATAAEEKARKMTKDGEFLTPEESWQYATTEAVQAVADKYGLNFSERSINSVIPDKNGDIDPSLAREIEKIFNNHLPKSQSESPAESQDLPE